MDRVEIQLKSLEFKINTLSSLRNTYINIVTIICGGICGLFLLPFSYVQLLLIILGIFTALFFITLTLKCIKEIQFMLLKIKEFE